MIYARINLSQTNYTQIDNAIQISDPSILIDKLDYIYITYCRYKQFTSVMPIFTSEYTDPNNDVIGYYTNNKLVAFSLIKRFDKENAECMQFAWDYTNPGLRLGINSLKHECALYKHMGFKYLYLGQDDDYKKQIAGFEILGTL